MLMCTVTNALSNKYGFGSFVDFFVDHRTASKIESSEKQQKAPKTYVFDALVGARGGTVAKAL